MIQRKKHTFSSSATNPSVSAGSKRMMLLEEDDEAEAIIKKPRNNDRSMSFKNFVVQTDAYDYPRLGQVPATYYRSVIADMQVREKDGVEILDVCYDIEDQYGREYHILQSYPAGSRPFKQLAAALSAAGVPNGATANAGIGVTEIICLDYVSKTSDFGSIIERKPYIESTDPDDQDEDDEDN